MDQLDKLREHMDARFDRVEEKVDNHMGRLSRTEADITWLKGHVQWVITILVAVAGFFATAFFSTWGGK